MTEATAVARTVIQLYDRAAVAMETRRYAAVLEVVEELVARTDLTTTQQLNAAAMAAQALACTGRREEALRHVAQVLALAHTLGNEVKAKAEIVAGNVHYKAGSFDVAFQHYERATALLLDVDLPGLLREVLINRAIALHFACRFHDAEKASAWKRVMPGARLSGLRGTACH